MSLRFTRFNVRALLGGSALAAAAVLGGCAPPPGQDNYRVETTDTTRAERNSPQVTLTELTEFSDQVVAQLTADLKGVPDLNRGYRSTIIFGDLVNKTGIVSTTDFEAFRSRTRSKLLQSGHVLQNIRFVEDRAKLEGLQDREFGGTRDVLQEGSRQTPSRQLNAEYTYFLNGEFYRVNREGRTESSNYYGLSFNLMKATDGEVVWTNSPYESKRVIPRR